MAEPSTGCFDRFWMMAIGIVVAIAVTAGAAVMSTGRVAAQEADWSRYTNGTLYLIAPVGGYDEFTMVEPPILKEGFLCAVVEQIGEEICAPLTNVAGLAPF